MLDKKEYVYMDCEIRLSKRAMADLLYAVIMTHSSIVTTYGINIYQCSPKQNTYNIADIRIHIHPELIDMFQELSGVMMRQLQSIGVFQ